MRRQRPVSTADPIRTIAEQAAETAERVAALAAGRDRLPPTTTQPPGWVTERREGGQVRVGLRNPATGGVAWLTDWF